MIDEPPSEPAVKATDNWALPGVMLVIVGAAGAVAPPPPLVNVSAKGAEISCSVPANTFSAAIACYAKADAISFLTASDLKPAAAAVIPANVKAAILVFGPAPKPATGLPWQVSVIEDFAADFPDGGALVANLSSQGIRFGL